MFKKHQIVAVHLGNIIINIIICVLNIRKYMISAQNDKYTHPWVDK